MSALYVLATSCAEPDEEFSSPMTLARALLAKRDALGRAGASGGARAEPACISALLSRGGLEASLVIAVRALDGAHGGRGTLLGYAFMPGQDGLARLRQALSDAAGATNAPGRMAS